MVSLFGATMAMTVTDVQGRFSLDKLPAGDYTLRAHLPGFVASRREHVRVGPAAAAPYRLELRRLDAPVATTGRMPDTLPARPIIAAGFGLPAGESATAAPAGEGDHSHSDTAWRLRHLPRSILKDSTNNPAVLSEEDDADAQAESMFGRTKLPSASVAAALFSDLPFSGEVNLLTTGVFAPGGLFDAYGQPRGVAYLAIGAPTPAGDWAVRAAMSEGDLSSWIVAGSFVSKRGPVHSYDLGLSYSTQEYQGGNPAALAAVSDGSRNVGEIYALDRWTVGPGVSFEYGGRYARYDYLARPGLFSPRAGFTLEPVKGTRVTAVLAQRMIAPGAEEFLSPAVAGAWLPPERTFSPLVGRDLRVQRARYLDVLFEHEFSGAYAVGVRRFFQGVDNQLMTLFGVEMASGPRSVGHYYVASAGSVDAQGWAVRLSLPASKRVRRIDRLQPDARPLDVARRSRVPRVRSVGARPGGAPEHPRHHDLLPHRHSGDGDARVRALQDQLGVHAADRGLQRYRFRWPLRRPGEPGSAVRPWRHEVGSARRRAQPVQRSQRSGVGVRRAARRPAAEARRRRIPGEILRGLGAGGRRSRPRPGGLPSGKAGSPIFFGKKHRSGFLNRGSTWLEVVRQLSL